MLCIGMYENFKGQEDHEEVGILRSKWKTTLCDIGLQVSSFTKSAISNSMKLLHIIKRVISWEETDINRLFPIITDGCFNQVLSV